MLDSGRCETDPAVSAYLRNAAVVTGREVLPPRSGKGGLLGRLVAAKTRAADPADRSEAEEVIRGLEGTLRPSGKVSTSSAG